MQFTRVVLAALVALGIALVAVAPATAQSTARNSLQGWSAGPVSFGDGYHRPGGSERVREVQQRLRRLGCRPGPIDGLFGPLTRASVARFQARHGLPANGRATLATVRRLRAPERTSGAEPAQRPATSKSPSVEPPTDPVAAVGETEPVGWIARLSLAALLMLLFAGLALLLLLVLLAAGTLFWRSRRALPATTQQAVHPSARALAYVLIPAGEADDSRFQAHAAAIETTCAARGLAVAGLVVDIEDDRLIWQRPGLAAAVRRLVDGEVDFLVVTQIEDATGVDLRRLAETTEGEIAIARWHQGTRMESRDDARGLSNA